MLFRVVKEEDYNDSASLYQLKYYYYSSIPIFYT